MKKLVLKLALSACILGISSSSWAIIPGVEHELPPCPPGPHSPYIAPVVSYEDGTIGKALVGPSGPVTLVDKIVIADHNDTGSDYFFYIEEADRSAGIRVYSSAAVTRGQSITVKNGRTSSPTQAYEGIQGDERDGVECVENITPNGETFIYLRSGDNPSIATGTGTVNLEPLGMENVCVGGSNSNYLFHTDPIAVGVRWGSNSIEGFYFGRGPYNKGLLIRIWGKVTSQDPQQGCFYIDDGAHYGNETSSNPQGIRIKLQSDITIPAVGKYVIVTGVSSSYEIVNEGFSPINCPEVLVRENADIVVLENDDAAVGPRTSTTGILTAPAQNASSCWNLVSLPSVPHWNDSHRPSTTAVFGPTAPVCENADLYLSLWRWNADSMQFCYPEYNSSYETYPYDGSDPQEAVFGPAYTGVGYWVKTVPGGAQNAYKISYVGVNGSTQTTDRYVMLSYDESDEWWRPGGIAAIGYPFEVGQELRNVRVTDGFQIMTIKTAIDQHWIEPDVYRWNNSSSGYESLGPPEVQPFPTLEPWRGYWIRSLKPHLGACPRNNLWTKYKFCSIIVV